MYVNTGSVGRLPLGTESEWKAAYKKDESAGTGEVEKGLLQTTATTRFNRGGAAGNVVTTPSAVLKRNPAER